jgi:predicted nucleic-acid-binding Zn-ribbon protein
MEKSCVKCNNELIKAHIKGLKGEFGVSKKPSGIFIGFSYIKVSPYVCSNCGYIEFYLEEDELNKFNNEK